MEKIIPFKNLSLKDLNQLVKDKVIKRSAANRIVEERKVYEERFTNVDTLEVIMKNKEEKFIDSLYKELNDFLDEWRTESKDDYLKGRFDQAKKVVNKIKKFKER